MDQKENAFNPLASIGKVIVALLLFFLTIRLFTVTSRGSLYFGIILLVFFTLPTVFVVFFKNMTLRKHPGFGKFWKVLKLIYVVIVALFVMVMIIAIYRWYGKNETANAVNFINSQKITLDDVMGKNLPPAPDQKLNDSTIAGIDANRNGIRDDVELAIFKNYPDSARMRAAELQFAQALQLELTKVSNNEIMMAFLKKNDSAYQCLGSTIMNKNLSAKDTLAILDQKDKEIKDLVLNIDSRKQQYSDIFEKYTTSYGSSNHNYCDIELSSLPN